MDPPAVIPDSDSRPTAQSSLNEWVAMHGPVWPAAALVIALDACARASRLTAVDLRMVIGSLNAAGIARREPGGWSWVPAAGSSPAQTVPDAEVIERLGAILFLCLMGQALAYPFPSEQAL